MGCITEDFKQIITGMFEQAEMPRETIAAVFKTIPVCPTPTGPAPAGGGASTRSFQPKAMAKRWPSAYYIDEKGEKHEADSPSKLFTELTGDRVSGQICDITTVTGKPVEKCRALSLVDNFTIHGYVVRGNGEPPPPSTGSKAEVEKAHDEWKRKLNEEGKHFIVMHPKAPQLQEAQKKAEAQPAKKKK